MPMTASLSPGERRRKAFLASLMNASIAAFAGGTAVVAVQYGLGQMSAGYPPLVEALLCAPAGGQSTASTLLIEQSGGLVPVTEVAAGTNLECQLDAPGADYATWTVVGPKSGTRSGPLDASVPCQSPEDFAAQSTARLKLSACQRARFDLPGLYVVSATVAVRGVAALDKAMLAIRVVPATGPAPPASRAEIAESNPGTAPAPVAPPAASAPEITAAPEAAPPAVALSELVSPQGAPLGEAASAAQPAADAATAGDADEEGDRLAETARAGKPAAATAAGMPEPVGEAAPSPIRLTTTLNLAARQVEVEHTAELSESFSEHGLLPQSQDFTRVVHKLASGDEFVSATFRARSAANASAVQVSYVPQSRSVTANFTLRSGPIIDRWRGWVTGTVVLRVRHRQEAREIALPESSLEVPGSVTLRLPRGISTDGARILLRRADTGSEAELAPGGSAKLDQVTVAARIQRGTLVLESSRE